MSLAIDVAWEYQLLTYPNPAVGAVIVKGGKVLAIEAHQKAGSSHAEVRALLKAYESLTSTKISFDYNDANQAHDFLIKNHHKIFADCSIFVTLEPCCHHGKTPSCASLLSVLGLKETIIGIPDLIEGHANGASMLKNVRFGVLSKRCEELIKPFLIWQKRALVVFKIAQTSNGRIGCGYLSCQESLIHTHKLRSVCTSMLIGGNTVRTDRPSLDCRFIGSKAPDITIYSRSHEFDRDIPLFDISDRSVTISDDLDFLNKPSFLLVEGGSGMINALKEYIDMLLIYQTPKLSSHALSYSVDLNLDFLHQTSLGIDILMWTALQK